MCKGSQHSDGSSVNLDCGGRELSAGRQVEDRHDLVVEAGHGTAYTDAADVGAAADAIHPAAFADVALHDGTPATEFDDAAPFAVLIGEVSLLIVARAVAAFVHRLTEKPTGAQFVVERNHWGLAGKLVQQIQEDFHEIIRLHRAAWHAHDRQAGLRFPRPT